MSWQVATQLKFACLLCLCIIAYGVERQRKGTSEFEGLEHSPVCIAKALSSCESLARPYNYVDAPCSLPELKSLLQEVQCDKIVSASDRSENNEMKSLLREIMLRLEKSENMISAIQDNLKKFTTSFVEIQKLQLASLEVFTVNDSSKPSDTAKAKVERNVALNSAKCPSDILDILIPGDKPERPKNCQEVRDLGHFTSGVQTIYPSKDCDKKPVTVFCDQDTDGGGWTVFQNRDTLRTREKFDRNWNEYVKGFGDLNGEFWLGLDNLHALVTALPMELRVDLEDNHGEKIWAKYGVFRVEDASSKYRLQIDDYSGDAGNSLGSHNGMFFSAYDQDNDRDLYANCAELHQGGWWFHGCQTTNLNGHQYVGKDFITFSGMHWNHNYRGGDYLLKKASMKVRPVSLRSR